MPSSARPDDCHARPADPLHAVFYEAEHAEGNDPPPLVAIRLLRQQLGAEIEGRSGKTTLPITALLHNGPVLLISDKADMLAAVAQLRSSYRPEDRLVDEDDVQ